MKFTDLPAPPSPALQNLIEFGALWELVASRPHTRVLEIGSLYGGTLWWWSQLPAVETLVSVDLLPPADTEEGQTARVARLNWPRWFAHVDFHGFRFDSQDPRIHDTVVAALGGALFDFAFIDGDHSYAGVKADWHRWNDLVAPGGIVAFHDTWIDSSVNCEPGVAAWCDELRHQLPSIQWTDPDGVGICAFSL